MRRKLQFLAIICCIMLALEARPQSSIELSDESGIVANGAVFHVWGDTSISNTMLKEFAVKNTTTGDISYKVRKTVIDTIPGSVNSFCFGTCYQATAYSSNPLIIAAGDDTLFSADYKAKGHLGESILTYNIYNISNPDDSVRIFIHFHGSAAGINENNLSQYFISNVYPAPASTSFSFDYSLPQNTAEARFVLIDLTGRVISESAITNTKGTFIQNTGEINNGFYLCQVYADNMKILTRKIVIQH